MQQAASTLQVSDAMVRRLVTQKTLPAKQIVRFAPWMIERLIDLPVVQEPFVSSVPVGAIRRYTQPYPDPLVLWSGDKLADI